ncbi:MAG: WD40/YVTN/BNR-like repeat-containing protein, partial [Acidimicrobiia bacterium]
MQRNNTHRLTSAARRAFATIAMLLTQRAGRRIVWMLGAVVVLSSGLVANSKRADAAVPSAPTNLTQTQGASGAIAVSFTQSSNGGKTITNYKYSTDGGQNFCAFSPAQTSSPVTITNYCPVPGYAASALTTNTAGYAIQLVAVNADGDSAAGLSAGANANNGITWSYTGAATSSMTQVYQMAYGTVGGTAYYVAVGRNGSYQGVIAYSTNGSTWTTYTVTTVTTFNRVWFANSRVYVQGGDNYNPRLWWATNPTAWANFTQASIPSTRCNADTTYTPGPIAIAANGSTMVAIGLQIWLESYYDPDAGETVYYELTCTLVYRSTDSGSSWSVVATPTWTNGVSDVIFGNGRYIANVNMALFSSTDAGATWTQVSNTIGDGRLAYGNGVFVAVTSWSNLARSSDGVTWSYTTLADTSAYQGLTFAGNRFVMGGSNVTYVSADGAGWLPAPQSLSLSDQYLLVVATNGTGQWVGFGKNAILNTVSPRIYTGTEAFVATAWSASSVGTPGQSSSLGAS